MSSSQNWKRFRILKGISLFDLINGIIITRLIGGIKDGEIGIFEAFCLKIKVAQKIRKKCLIIVLAAACA